MARIDLQCNKCQSAIANIWNRTNIGGLGARAAGENSRDLLFGACPIDAVDNPNRQYDNPAEDAEKSQQHEPEDMGVFIAIEH